MTCQVLYDVDLLNAKKEVYKIRKQLKENTVPKIISAKDHEARAYTTYHPGSHAITLYRKYEIETTTSKTHPFIF